MTKKNEPPDQEQQTGQPGEVAHLDTPSAKKKPAAVGVVCNVLFVCAVLLTIVLVVLSFAQGDGKRNVSVLGVSTYVVLSDSMSPTFNAGSLVVAYRSAPERIEVGDIITFMAHGTDVLVTHRVVRIEDTGSGPSFITKGDANNGDDRNPVTAGQLQGKVVFWINGVGRLVAPLRNPFVLVCLIVFLTVIVFLPDVIRKLRQN